MRVIQCIQQGDQWADQCGIETTDFIIGLDAIAGRASADGIAQQHAAQAEPPTVLLQLVWQAQAGALLGVKAPADAGTFDPAVQCGQVAFLDRETFTQRRNVEQVENFTHGEAAVREFQQMLDGDQQRVAAALALVGKGEGDKAWVGSFQLTEHGANMRCVAVNVGDHDDDVARAQLGIGAEPLEQLVVENFHFALGAVGNVEADGAVVIEVDAGPQLTRFVEWAQFENVILQLIEQCGRFAFAEQVDAPVTEGGAVAVGVVVTVQQADVVTALFAPGGEQRVRVLVQGLRVDGDRHSDLARLAFVLVAQQVFVRNDVRPMVATRVMYAQQDLAESRQASERFQRLCGQRGNAENNHTGRQALGGFLEGVDPLNETLMNTGTAFSHALFTDIQ